MGVYILYVFRINTEVKESKTYSSKPMYNNGTLSVENTNVEEDTTENENSSEYEDENPNLIG